jgi:hypothetical protein
MADSFQHYSEMLTLPTLEQRAWAQDLLERIERMAEAADDLDEEDIPQQGALAEAYKDGLQHGTLAGRFILQEQGLWLTDDGGDGSLDLVAAIVQEYLQTWAPENHWTLTWAETCSAPRFGAFGGGALVVTAKEIHWMDTWSWAQTALA